MQERIIKKYHYGWSGTSEHKKGTKCGCHRPNCRLKNRVANRPTDKKIAMMRKWNRDELGRKM